MAHFAQLNSDSSVINVVVVDNANLLDENNVENESVGIAYLESHLGTGPWVQTSYSGRIRCRYAGIGMVYDPVEDVFRMPEAGDVDSVIHEASVDQM